MTYSNNATHTLKHSKFTKENSMNLKDPYNAFMRNPRIESAWNESSEKKSTVTRSTHLRLRIAIQLNPGPAHLRKPNRDLKYAKRRRSPPWQTRPRRRACVRSSIHRPVGKFSEVHVEKASSDGIYSEEFQKEPNDKISG